MSAHLAGAYNATLLVMVIVMKGGGRAPSTLTSRAHFTLMTESTPESSGYYSVYSVVPPYPLPPRPPDKCQKIGIVAFFAYILNTFQSFCPTIKHGITSEKKLHFVIVAVLQDPLAQAALLDLSLKEEEVEQWVTCLAAKFNASAR